MTGPGCSSLAYGAVTESGSFRMNKDGKTLFRNNYAWNHGDKTLRLFAPDIYIFHLLYIIKYVMSIKKRKKYVMFTNNFCMQWQTWYSWNPAGVRFWNSSTTSDSKLNGDKFNDQDSYTFSYQLAWKVPPILNQGFLHSRRESFGGHYVSQLACTFLLRNKNTKSTISTSKELMWSVHLINRLFYIH